MHNKGRGEPRLFRWNNFAIIYEESFFQGNLSVYQDRNLL